ncbi:hypothetical protein HE1_00816 [Holospora elegans E1]|uniref:Uncharacterized protein n=1 Tax=Holospora elegans E1 TaxID=1427503 RepID=A0A023DYG0_9PROT|nr:hypothetical protein HE1_00816 [Holospora elegans E1]
MYILSSKTRDFPQFAVPENRTKKEERFIAKCHKTNAEFIIQKPKDLKFLYKKKLAHFESKHPTLINIYGDPSHIHHTPPHFFSGSLKDR